MGKSNEKENKQVNNRDAMWHGEGHGRLRDCRRKQQDDAAATRTGKLPTRWVVLPRPAPHLRRRAKPSWQSLWQSSLLRATPSGDLPIGLVSVCGAGKSCQPVRQRDDVDAQASYCTSRNCTQKPARWAPSRSVRSPELFTYRLHRLSARYRHSPGFLYHFLGSLRRSLIGERAPSQAPQAISTDVRGANWRMRASPHSRSSDSQTDRYNHVAAGGTNICVGRYTRSVQQQHTRARLMSNGAGTVVQG